MKPVTNCLYVLLLLFAGACRSPATVPGGAGGAGDEPHFTGTILDVPQTPPSSSTLTSLLVEHPGVSGPADRSVVHVTPDTRIRIRSAAGAERAGVVADLQPGAIVAVWTTGVELRSYPRQVSATRIEVRRPPS